MKINPIKMAGVIVLYKPDVKEVVKNVSSYIDWLELLFVWCNSPISEDEKIFLSQAFPHKMIRWMGDETNQGMAHALNASSKMALELGSQFLLTMDQDSFFYSDDFLHAFKKLHYIDAAIWAPWGYGEPEVQSVVSFEAKKVSLVITSGSLIHLEKWSLSGGFDEDFFIDEVDHDYCLRIKELGWSVFRLFPVRLGHRLGVPICYRFMGLKREVVLHSGVRLYYSTRNTLLLTKKHFLRFPFIILTRIWYMVAEWVKVLLFSSIRATELRYIRKGVLDFFRGHLGKAV